jgi:hypothetical protein
MARVVITAFKTSSGRTDRFAHRHASALRSTARLLSVVFMLCISPSISAARLHVGTFALAPGQGWDFSDSLLVGSTPGSADISYELTVHTTRETFPDFLFAYFEAGLVYIGSADSTYEKLEEAPEDTGQYVSLVDAYSGDVFAIRTREGHYAKIRILPPSGGQFQFEFVYQDDGTRTFMRSVAIRPTTWGRIKSLYFR